MKKTIRMFKLNSGKYTFGFVYESNGKIIENKRYVLGSFVSGYKDIQEQLLNAHKRPIIDLKNFPNEIHQEEQEKPLEPKESD